MVVGILIFVAAFAGITFMIVREVRSARNPRPNRDAQDGLPVRFRCSVYYKRDAGPSWALGAVGFDLVVRRGSFAVLGPGECASWYLSATPSTVEWCSPTRRGPDWIILGGNEQGNPVRLWLRPHDSHSLWDIWSALVSEGAEPLTDPPLEL